jgi:hypothetical protein
VTETSTVLDEAFERLASSGFELPNGFVNHGPMACEALAALDCDEVIADWARRFGRARGADITPVVPHQFDWEAALGDYARLPEWIGFFEQSVADDGWSEVVATWVPRLMPGLAVALFHGAIRSAHAVRAVAAVDTAPRRAELARAMGYWAARFRQYETALPVEADGDLEEAVTREAANGAHHYLARPDIFSLHGVTGAMAVQLLVSHLRPVDGSTALGQVRAEHLAMYGKGPGMTEFDVAGVDGDVLAGAAAAGHDPHEVKLVEACRRGMAITGDPVFAAAAEVVVGMDR